MTDYTKAELRASKKLLLGGSVVAWCLYTAYVISIIYDKFGTQQYFYVSYEFVTGWIFIAVSYSIIGLLIGISIIRCNEIIIDVK